jgi:hypothetical protein
MVRRKADPAAHQLAGGEPSSQRRGRATASHGFPDYLPSAKLEPDAIGAAQDTIIGMASSAPAATVGLSLAALAVATAYGSGPILILTAIPMLIIANAYRRLNLWKANTGASFEWVGRAINPSPCSATYESRTVQTVT